MDSVMGDVQDKLWRMCEEFADLDERPKAEALGYLEATAKTKADPYGMTTKGRTTASAVARATAGPSTAPLTIRPSIASLRMTLFLFLEKTDKGKKQMQVLRLRLSR